MRQARKLVGNVPCQSNTKNALLFLQTRSFQQKMPRWQLSLWGKHQCELACHKRLYWSEVSLSSEVTSPQAQTECDGEQWQNHLKVQVPKPEHQLHGGLTTAMQPSVQPYSSHSFEYVTFSHSLLSQDWGHMYRFMLVWCILNIPHIQHTVQIQDLWAFKMFP